MRTEQEVEMRRRWALDHFFPQRAADNYAVCDDPEEEEDWMDWYDARCRAAQRMAERLAAIAQQCLT